MTKRQFTPGQSVIIARPDPQHGFCGLSENMLHVSGKIMGPAIGETLPDPYHFEFRHPASQRFVTAPLPASMFEPYDPQYDSIMYCTRESQVELHVMMGMKVLGTATVKGYGDRVHPFPTWPEIMVRMMKPDVPEIIAKGRSVAIWRMGTQRR